MEEELSFQSALGLSGLGLYGPGDVNNQGQTDFQSMMQVAQSQGTVEPDLNRIQENPVEFRATLIDPNAPRLS